MQKMYMHFCIRVTNQVAADCLAKMIRQAQSNVLMIGLADDLTPKGIVILRLYLYAMMSGLINFSKSEVILIHGDENKSLLYADLFNCQIGPFP